MIVFRLTLSRTSTRPRWTVILVPSQRSCVLQRVPRTVAAALRPLVRKEPLAFPNSRRTRFLERFRRCEVDAVVVRHALRNDEPFSGRSVRSCLDRRLTRTWRILKRPRKNWPCCSLRPVVAALRSFTRPLLVSRIEPTGIVSAPSSRTKPLGGLACDALADPAG